VKVKAILPHLVLIGLFIGIFLCGCVSKSEVAKSGANLPKMPASEVSEIDLVSLENDLTEIENLTQELEEVSFDLEEIQTL